MYQFIWPLERKPFQSENRNGQEKRFSLVIVAGDDTCTCMSCGWKEGLGWGEEVSEKGSVKQTTHQVCVNILVTRLSFGIMI